MEIEMNVAQKPKILVIDDHKLVAELLSEVLAANGENDVSYVFGLNTALEKIASSGPYDLVLLDYNLPEVIDLNAFHVIKSASPKSRIAIISGSMRKSVVTEAMGAGAAGFLPKSFPIKAMEQAVKLIMSGVNFIPAEMGLMVDEGANTEATSLSELSATEKAVLKRLISGKTNKAIGNELEKSEVTVKMYVRAICRKLNVSNRTQAAMAGRDLRLV